jgi:tetratricopeptide (TPR) repeat protein
VTRSVFFAVFYVFLALNIFIGFGYDAEAATSRKAAQTLSEAAPDQDTLHELLAPEVDSDDDVAELAEKDTERVKKLEALNEVYKTSTSAIKKAGALFETGTLLQERYFYLRDVAVNNYLAVYDKWWIGETLIEPELKLDVANEELLKLINISREHASNFSDDPRIAEINWRIGSSMARLGSEHAELYLNQAMQLSRSPEWGQKARLSKADWLLSRGKFDEAIAGYTEIHKANISDSLKAYAAYRMGWAFLSKSWSAPEKERNVALGKAEAALKLAFLGVKEDDETRFKLKSEAAKDLAWLWAYTENETQAAAFFEKQGITKKMLPIFKDKQAEEWLRQGKLDKAVPYYQAKMTADPENPQIPDIHLRLAHAYIVAGDVKSMRQELEVLNKLTSDKEDPWFDEHEDDVELISRVKKMQEFLPKTVGFRIFAAAQAQKNEKLKKEMLATAIKELENQGKQTKDPAQQLAIRITITEALTALERYQEVLTQLDAIVAMGPKAGDQLAGAASDRLNLIIKLDEAQTYPAVPAPGEVRRPMPLPELKQRFALAAQDYMRIVPKSENELNLRFQIVQDLFSYGHYDDALPLYEGIGMQFPRTEQGKISIETLVSMNLKRKNWDEIIRLSTAFLNNREVKGKELRDFLKQSLDWAKEQKGV